MSSFEKHYTKKKNIFNGGNYLLSPLNNKKINSINFFNTNRKNNNTQNKNGIKVIVNKINTTQLKKKYSNSEDVNNIVQINKTYSLSRPKNKNNLNSNKIMYTYSNINESNLSSAKINKYGNKFENNTTYDDINMNNKGYNLKKLYINKKIKDINFSSKNDSFNNIKNINNTNSYISNRQSYDLLKTDANSTSSDLNIKLVLPGDNIFGKKLVNQNYDDIIGTPSGLFKKKNQSNFKYNTPGNILKNYYNNPNIKFNKEEQIIKESFINQTTNSKNKKRIKSIDKSMSGVEYYNEKNKRHKNRCPEDLHFFYINMIQKGKKMENNIEGE